MKTVAKIAGLVAAVALIATGIGALAGGQMMLMIGGGIAASTIASVASAVAMGASLLAGKPKMPSNSQENINRLRVTIEPRTFRKTMVGTSAMATDLRDEEYTDSQTYLHRFIVCASHEVHSIDEIWFDDKQAWTLAGGVQGEFVGYLTVDAVPLGNTAYNISARMGASRKFTGLANIHLRYKLTGNTKKTDSPFAQGITTRVTIRGKGARMYDPRLDSTAGGSGAHRADDQTTWAWDDDACNNPALQLLFYLLGWQINGELAVGRGIPPARIDLPSFAAAANICDESVTAAGGGTEPRYRSAGVWSEGDNPTTVIDMLKACMNADLDDVDGKLRLTIFTDDTFASDADFTADDVLGAFEWTPFVPLDQSFNVISGSYTDPSDTSLYQQVDYPRVEVASPDGIERIETLNLPMVQSPGQAQRLASLRVQRQAFGGSFTAEFQATAWRAQKNSIVRLTFPPLGFVNKVFRVAEMDLRVDGVVPMVLREEDPDIYTAPAVTLPTIPVDNVLHDPALDPLIDAIDTASTQSARVAIYQRAASAPTQPPATATYTFATAGITGLDNGWLANPPSGSNPLYVSYATASAATATDTIASGEWTAAVILVQDGSAGPGSLNARVRPANIQVASAVDGTVSSYTGVSGTFIIEDAAGTAITSGFTLSTGNNPQSLTMSYTGLAWSVTAGFDNLEVYATVEIVATGSGAYAGQVYRATVSLQKDRPQVWNFVANGNEENYLVPDAPTITTQPTYYRTGQTGGADIYMGWSFPYNSNVAHKNNVDTYERVFRKSAIGSAWTGPGTDTANETRLDWQLGVDMTTPANQFFVNDGAGEFYYSCAVRAIRYVHPNGSYPDGVVKGPWAVSTTPMQPFATSNITANINGTPATNVSTGVVRAIAAINGSNQIETAKVLTGSIASNNIDLRTYASSSSTVALAEQVGGDTSTQTSAFSGGDLVLVGSKLEVQGYIPVRLRKTNPVNGTTYSMTIEVALRNVTAASDMSGSPVWTLFETWQNANATGTYDLSQILFPVRWLFTGLTPGHTFRAGYKISVTSTNGAQTVGTKYLLLREPRAST